MKIKYLGLCWLLSACQTTPSPPAKTPVTVVRAISGNTVELADQRRIRLTGIDAPVLSQQPWGNAAKDYLDGLIRQGNHQFLLEMANPPSTKTTTTSKPDDRQFGYLWHNNTLVNEQVVKAGHALAMTRYADPDYAQRLSRAQSYARLVATGIWSRTTPLRTSPRDFKSDQR